ncbi:PDZ domain-containing protein [Sphingomonas sp. LB-2]|uniref:PDZ domain-containing protein n=1 Tax=Sphingomonas caeni TaxID=2984949 RepID=UPI002231B693|nr:PDZ domain-containing protein [Sphingomonas caeni]MCW3847655.1 PDZ domain-containing protein [Sphingomonas caeni]
MPGLILAVALSTAATQTADDIGTRPSFEQGVALGERAIKGSLIDPGSAQIEWPYDFTGGSLKPLIGRRQAGYYTCGWVNAKNRMGGYTGRVWFLLMIRNDVVVSLSIGSVDGVDTATATCPGLLKRGFLRAAPSRNAGPPSPQASSARAALGDGEAPNSEAPVQTGFGVTFVQTPFGAMITAIAAGSPAEKAGLKPGAVIESVNGIQFKGFDLATMQNVLQAAHGTVTLGIVGVGDVKVVRP